MIAHPSRSSFNLRLPCFTSPFANPVNPLRPYNNPPLILAIVLTSLAADVIAPPPQAVFGFSADITELRQANRALRRSEARFCSLFDLAGVGTLSFNTSPAHVIADVSEGACDMLGASADELVGTRIEELVLPEDWAATLPGLERFLGGGEERFVCEMRCVKRDGGQLWARVTVTLAGEDLEG